MSAGLRRTLAAAFATLTALVALLPVLDSSSWVPSALGAVATVAVAGAAGRAAHLPRVLQPVLSLLLLGGYLLLVFAHGTFRHGLPSGSTLPHLRHLLQAANSDLSRYATPVPTHQGLVLVVVAGVGAVALAVDLLAVTLDRVAPSGLPLLALFAVPSAVLPHGLGSWAFAVGATGWLVLLMEEGSERVSRWGTPLRHALPGARAGGDDSSVGRVGRRIGAAALGVALVVPVVVPGLDHRLIGRQGAGDSAGDGPSSATTYNPITTLRDQLTLPRPRQLFVYSTTDDRPDYIRMTTLDNYTGSGWGSGRLEADREQARVQKGIAVPVGEDGGLPHRDLTMRVAIDGGNLDVHWLPLPYGPRKVAVDGAWLWDSSSQTVFSAARSTKDLRPYTVTASRVVPTREGLEGSAGSPVALDVLSQYGGSVTVPAEVKALAARITRGARTHYDQAVAIQSWFTSPGSGFVYDLDPTVPAPGEDALSAFLRGKHGFCQQYATAMAVLLRLQGIPSRVAVGFTSGQPVKAGSRTYSVTTADAHAWPEAWFPGAGWVRFEPTPQASGATTPGYSLPPQNHPTPPPTNRPTPGPVPSKGPGSFHDADTLLGGGPPPSTPLLDPTGHRTAWTLGGLVLVLLLLSPSALTALRRRSRARSGKPLSAWEQLRDDVHDVYGPWRAADSPRAVAVRLAPLVGPAHAALERLAHAAELSRYAPAGRRTGADLVADGAAVRKALRESARRPVRVRAVLAPRSTMAWASQLLGAAVADVLDGVDRLLAWLFRPFARVLRPR